MVGKRDFERFIFSFVIIIFFFVPSVFAAYCDVVYVIDVSVSTGPKPGYGNEIVDIKKAINDTVIYINNSGINISVGGVSFYNVTEPINEVYNLTTNYTDFQDWINSIESREDSENVFSALNKSLSLNFTNPKKIIFLFTDDPDYSNNDDDHPPHYCETEALFSEKEASLFAFLNETRDDMILDEEIERLVTVRGGKYYYDSVTNTSFMYNKVIENLQYSGCFGVSVNKIQCYNSTDWVECQKMQIGDSLTQVRANCTSFSGNIINTTFKLQDTTQTFFEHNASSNESDWWVYNNDDIILTENREYKLTATCYNNNSLIGKGSISWGVQNQGINGCKELFAVGEEYYLTNNLIPTSGPCINISAPDITLDCQGYWIRNTALNAAGIYSTQFNTTIKNCNITMGTGWPGVGIRLEEASHPYIYNNTLNYQRHGVFMNSTFHSTIENNTMNSNELDGTYIDSSSCNTVIDNTLHSNKRNAITLNPYSFPSSGADHNQIINNDIWNCTFGGGDYSCIYLYEANYNLFLDNKIDKGYVKGISIASSGSGDNSSHNIFQNTNMTNIDGIDVYLFDGTSSQNLNNTFLNFTYGSESVDTNSELIRKWYYRAYVNDTNNNPISNVNITAYNRTNNYQFNLTTDESGYTNITEIIDYINKGGTKTYYSNYTIYASHPLYESANHLRNVTELKNIYKDVFTLTSLINDTHKFYIKNASGSNVAWFGSLGNIILKGKCFSGGASYCDSPGENSFIIRNSTNNNVAFINATGDLCIEKGDCSDQNVTCNPTRDAFIIRNSTNSNMSYIDFDGDLCLVGKLYQNSNP